MPVFKKKTADGNEAVASSPVTGAEDIRKKVGRLSVATAAAAVVAAGAIGFAAVDHTTSASQLNAITGNMSEVVVAVDTVPAGATITPEMLTTAAVPATYVSAGAINDASLVVGHKAIVEIAANSQVRAGEVAAGDEGGALAAKIESKQKAVTIDTSAASAYSQKLLRQGDRCTLYAFCDSKVAATLKATSDSVTVSTKTGKKKYVLATDVEILALDGYTSYADMQAAGVDTYSTITFQVSKSQAEKIRALQDQGVTIWPIVTASADVKHKTAPAAVAESGEADTDGEGQTE